jgi:hypothetical protein
MLGWCDLLVSGSEAAIYPKGWVCSLRIWRFAEAKPMASTTRNKTFGFPGIPIRDARSAEWELMSALSLMRSVRGHGFQMHHYRGCAGDPLKN